MFLCAPMLGMFEMAATVVTGRVMGNALSNPAAVRAARRQAALAPS